jgi:hypothetical protein
MLIRRLRGLVASIAGGALVGGAAGATLGLIWLLAPGPKTITVTPNIPGGVVIVPMLWGTAVGALSGCVFGILMMVAERSRGIQELRAYRVAMWAALATAPALRLGGGSWSLVAFGSGIAAGIGAVATLLAKRGRDHATVEVPAPLT